MKHRYHTQLECLRNKAGKVTGFRCKECGRFTDYWENVAYWVKTSAMFVLIGAMLWFAMWALCALDPVCYSQNI